MADVPPQLQPSPALPAALPIALSGREAAAAAVAVAGETIVVLLAFSTGVSLSVALGVHAIVVVATCAILFRDRTTGEDLTVAAIMALVIALAGPAGAVAAFAMLPFAGHTGAGPEILAAWYTRLANAGRADAATTLHDRVTAGRVQRFDAAAPQDFEHILDIGSLAERQAALGLMARKFHTDFAPALQSALRSPEPVVRVQAAAVVARVRADLKVRIKALVAIRHERPVPGGVVTASELLRLADCSLVDRADGERCRRAADNILRSALATGADVTRAAAADDLNTAPVVENFLLGAGRLKDFRIARRVHDLVARSGYRVRRLGQKRTLV